LKHPPVTHLQDTGHSWLEPHGSPLPPSPSDYPKRKFHGLDESKVVENPDEEKALGFGWHDSPTQAKAAHEKIAAENAKAKNDGVKHAEQSTQAARDATNKAAAETKAAEEKK